MNIAVLIAALIAVENSAPDARGDGGASWGVLQIKAIHIAEVRRTHGAAWRHEHAFTPEYAAAIARDYYAGWRRGGKIVHDLTPMQAAMLWNAGPSALTKTGRARQRAEAYGRRVEAEYWRLARVALAKKGAGK